MDQSIKPASPKWGRSTKIIVAVSLLALTVAVIIRFQELFPPLIMALIIAYLFYPTASFLERRARMPWGLSVTLIYLVLALIIIGLLALGGFEIVSQIQSLIDAIESLLEQLPLLLDSLKLQVIVIGPYTPIPLFADSERVHALSEFGVVLVMFGVGLELSFFSEYFGRAR